MTNITKTTVFAAVILAFFAFSAPRAHAGVVFNPLNPIDPFCLFSCKNNQPQNVTNYTDSNNVINSNNTINSNNVNSTITGSGNTVSASGQSSTAYVDSRVVWPDTPSPASTVINNNSNTVTTPSYQGSGVVWPSSSPTIINNNSNTVTTPAVVYTTGSRVVWPEPTYYPPPAYNYNPPLYVSCYSSSSSVNTGSYVTWRASVSGGNGSYYYSWSGTEGLYGNGSSISKTYSYAGSKTATVTVNSNGQTTSANCSTVTVYDYNYNNNYDNNNYQYYSPLSVSCRANTTFSPAGSIVNWIAYPTGGSGNYTYSWSGTDNINGYQNSINATYYTPGQKYANVTVYSNGQQTSSQCSSPVTVGVPNTTYNYQPAPVKYVTQTQTKIVYVKASPSPTPTPVVVAPTSSPLVAAPILSLKDVPWGWVAVLVILVLLGTIFYLIFNKKNM